MPKPIRTRPVSGAQVRAYAGKAEEYADAAANELDAGRYIAATSLAVHAGINAADAVCGARLGHRAAGDDHDQVHPRTFWFQSGSCPFGRCRSERSSAVQAFGAMSVTVGKYVRYRPTSRVSNSRSATAAWAPMKKSGSVDNFVPWFRR